MLTFGRCATTITLITLALTACTGRTILHGARTHKAPKAERNNKIAVWFVRPASNGDPKLASVSRTIRGADKLEEAVHELLEGPTAYEEHSGFGTEIPRGTIMIDLKRSPKSVELNLSRRFASGGGTSSFETRLEQLRRTVASAADAPVYLNVEGKRLNVSEGEGIEIKQPINR
jgi:spore germination protein GerM